jgi:L-rhamnonate dehydratase
LPLRSDPRPVPVLLVEVATDVGVTGHALSFVSMRSAVMAFLRDEASTLLSGHPALPEAVRELLEQRMAHRPMAGVWAAAASLIDIAVWDALGQHLGAPVWQLLGGARDRVEVYVTFGLPSYSRNELMQLATTLASAGHTGLKLVVGEDSGVPGVSLRSSQLEADASRVRAVREAVGSDIALMIDANKRLTLPQAVGLARRVEDCDLAWFEDPVAWGDPALTAQLRQRTSIPIAGGSLGVGDVPAFAQLINSSAVDIAQPNVRDLGGFTGARRAVALAQAHRIPIAMGGNWPHLNAHLYAGVARSGPVEFHLQGWEVARCVYQDPPEPSGGCLRLSAAPGLGLRLLEEAVEQFTVA